MTRKVRSLQPHDHDFLRSCCWPLRSEAEIDSLLTRAYDFREQQRGDGLVVREDDKAIAFGLLTIWPTVAEISDLIVQEACRSQGIGTQLIYALCDLALDVYGVQAIEIGVFLNNPRAYNLYERLGFVPHRTIKLQDGSPETTIVYLQKRHTSIK